MSIDAIEGTVLDVRLARDEICLCLDTNGLWQKQEKADPVVTVLLEGCRDATEALDRLRLRPGDQVSLVPVEEAGAVVGAFLELDYGADEVQIACGCITQETRGYTPEELQRRCRWLREEYHRSEDGRIAAEQKYTRLTIELTEMAGGELERSRRKRAFFQGTNPERAAEMDGRIAAYERVLTRMARSREPGEGAA